MPNKNTTNRNKTNRNKNKNNTNRNKTNRNINKNKNNTRGLRIRKPFNKNNNNNNLYVSPMSPQSNFYALSPNTTNNITPKTKTIANILQNRKTMLQRAHSYNNTQNYSVEQLAKNLETITEGLEKP